jgi:hypothetical protein
VFGSGTIILSLVAAYHQKDVLKRIGIKHTDFFNREITKKESSLNEQKL